MAVPEPSESGPRWPEWVLRRWRYGPLPLPWDRPQAPPWERLGRPQSLLSPPAADESPMPLDGRMPALPPLDADPFVAPAAEPVAAPRLPLTVRLNFVIFGACFAVPPAIILLVLFGRGLAWTDWLAYIGGGAAGLGLLSAFFFGVTAGTDPEAR